MARLRTRARASTANRLEVIRMITAGVKHESAHRAQLSPTILVPHIGCTSSGREEVKNTCRVLQALLGRRHAPGISRATGAKATSGGDERGKRSGYLFCLAAALAHESRAILQLKCVKTQSFGMLREPTNSLSAVKRKHVPEQEAADCVP